MYATSLETMAEALLEAFPDERVLQENALATVTPNWVILRGPDARSHTILSVKSVDEVRRIKTTYPGLVVIAAGLFVIAAGAFNSKDGRGAGIPLAVIGAIFLVLYFGSRKAAVRFRVGDEISETVPGTLRDATVLIEAVQKAQSAF